MKYVFNPIRIARRIRAVLLTASAVVAVSILILSETSDLKAKLDDSGGWIFSKAPYTNNPQTGQRVNQYKKEKTPYRDPYSFFDSPHEAFPFEADSADSFFYGYPYYSSGIPFYATPYQYENGMEEQYPYDSDPNN